MSEAITSLTMSSTAWRPRSRSRQYRSICRTSSAVKRSLLRMYGGLSETSASLKDGVLGYLAFGKYPPYLSGYWYGLWGVNGARTRNHGCPFGFRWRMNALAFIAR